MGQPLSMDLRVRLLAAVDAGLSCRAAAARFGVAPSTAIRWYAQRRDVGDLAAKPQGGDMRSRRVDERASDILALWEAQKDITLVELRLALAEMGLAVSVAGLPAWSPQDHYAGRRPAHDWRANRPRPLGPHRQARRHLPTRRVRQLLQLLRISSRLIENRSKLRQT
jgi:transposase